MATTQQDMIRRGYQALVDALGPVDAIRFIQHFSPGTGNYTEERHQWLDQFTPDEIFAQIQQARKSAEPGLKNYDEVIE
jgi:hypothetical protein